ncbi:hypothetical protein PBPRA2141 [Photobacterium profundum SS9]|uniref:Uncharacterized protein n=1 Tax=Photobacterium profundum (strain SS9) TaxID=298386 RepID=Q6LQ87_PHOPR|nr:hypothetical protein PBPRA2141 [Photobacterium profundum SS9]
MHLIICHNKSTHSECFFVSKNYSNHTFSSRHSVLFPLPFIGKVQLSNNEKTRPIVSCNTILTIADIVAVKTRRTSYIVFSSVASTEETTMNWLLNTHNAVWMTH